MPVHKNLDRCDEQVWAEIITAAKETFLEVFDVASPELQCTKVIDGKNITQWDGKDVDPWTWVVSDYDDEWMDGPYFGYEFDFLRFEPA